MNNTELTKEQRSFINSISLRDFHPLYSSKISRWFGLAILAIVLSLNFLSDFVLHNFWVSGIVAILITCAVAFRGSIGRKIVWDSKEWSSFDEYQLHLFSLRLRSRNQVVLWTFFVSFSVYNLGSQILGYKINPLGLLVTVILAYGVGLTVPKPRIEVEKSKKSVIRILGILGVGLVVVFGAFLGLAYFGQPTNLPNYSDQNVPPAPANPITQNSDIPTRKSLTFNGAECPIYTEIDNLYRGGEKIVFTEPCPKNQDVTKLDFSASIFRVNGSEIKYIFNLDNYGINSDPTKPQIKFMDSNNFILLQGMGEGGECGGHFEFSIPKVDLLKGTAGTVSHGESGGSCFDPNVENSCFSFYRKFSVGEKTLELNFSCKGPSATSDMDFSMNYLNKQVAKFNVQADPTFEFSELDNTYNVLTGQDLSFKLNGRTYYFDTATSQLR